MKISDSTGTVSGTVSARNNVHPVWSRNIFFSGAGTCDLPYRKLVCGPWRKVGSSKERVRTADERRSVPNTCSLPPTGRRRAINRPSTLLLMTLEFQELATAITPICQGVYACVSVNAAATVLVTIRQQHVYRIILL